MKPRTDYRIPSETNENIETPASPSTDYSNSLNDNSNDSIIPCTSSRKCKEE